MSLWKVGDKDALSAEHYEHCVGGRGANEGQKARLLCMDSGLRASQLAAASNRVIPIDTQA